MNNNLKEQEELRQRVIALLTREQIDFLDKLGKDARFSTGKKLTHTKIISYLIDILMRLGVDGKGIKTPQDLEEKIKSAVMKTIITTSLFEKPEPSNDEKIIDIQAVTKEDKLYLKAKDSGTGGQER